MHVDITHTYIGDLRLVLTAPSGTSVVLHRDTLIPANRADRSDRSRP
ncbi:MAG TPA: proprotein convertase P-domain-containing protein [Gammaproteobacteria bacterium]|nr:proprotein convertase P-domain-containing protein [Gammaproteobacteria bacterium]